MKSMQVVVRPMRDEDVESVARLRCATFFKGTARTLQDDIEGLHGLLGGEGRHAAFVATHGTVVVGSVLLVEEELDAAHDLSPWLAGLVVTSDHRCLGIGGALVKAVEIHAAGHGVRKIHLYTGAAENFYAARGWAVAERFVQDGEAAVLMTRDPS